MNSKVPSNSMIQDFVLLSITQGMVDHKKAMKKAEQSFLVFHYQLFVTQRVLEGIVFLESTFSRLARL